MQQKDRHHPAAEYRPAEDGRDEEEAASDSFHELHGGIITTRIPGREW
jgi:hypothetical protein